MLALKQIALFRSSALFPVFRRFAGFGLPPLSPASEKALLEDPRLLHQPRSSINAPIATLPSFGPVSRDRSDSGHTLTRRRERVARRRKEGRSKPSLSVAAPAPVAGTPWNWRPASYPDSAAKPSSASRLGARGSVPPIRLGDAFGLDRPHPWA